MYGYVGRLVSKVGESLHEAIRVLLFFFAQSFSFPNVIAHVSGRPFSVETQVLRLGPRLLQLNQAAWKLVGHHTQAPLAIAWL